MQLTKNSIETTVGPSEWFTGAVYLDTVTTPAGPSRLSASSVHIIEDAVVGKSLAVIPNAVPFDIAALNEPMVVALHCVNRSEARTRTRSWCSGPCPSGSEPRSG